MQSYTHQSFHFASFPLCLLLVCSSVFFLVVGGSMNFAFINHVCIIKDGEVLQSGRSCWTSLGVRSLQFCLAVGSSDRKMRWLISFFVHSFLRLFCWVGSTQQYVNHVKSCYYSFTVILAIETIFEPRGEVCAQSPVWAVSLDIDGC